jgi:hypothetical protein
MKHIDNVKTLELTNENLKKHTADLNNLSIFNNRVGFFASPSQASSISSYHPATQNFDEKSRHSGMVMAESVIGDLPDWWSSRSSNISATESHHSGVVMEESEIGSLPDLANVSDTESLNNDLIDDSKSEELEESMETSQFRL